MGVYFVERYYSTLKTSYMVIDLIDKKVTFDPILTLQWFLSMGAYLITTALMGG
jgi:hypothetical protein